MLRRDFAKALGIGGISIFIPQFGRFFREGSSRLYVPEPIELKQGIHTMLRTYNLGFSVTEEMLKADLYDYYRVRSI